jgi:hypothetical protein
MSLNQNVIRPKCHKTKLPLDKTTLEQTILLHFRQKGIRQNNIKQNNVRQNNVRQNTVRQNTVRQGDVRRTGTVPLPSTWTMDGFLNLWQSLIEPTSSPAFPRMPREQIGWICVLLGIVYQGVFLIFFHGFITNCKLFSRKHSVMNISTHTLSLRVTRWVSEKIVQNVHFHLWG